MKILSLKFRMMAYSTIMVIILLPSLSAILLYLHNKNIWEEFNLRAASHAAHLSRNLQLPVLLENKKDIERLLEGTLKVQDVISVTVFDKNQKILVRSRNPFSIPADNQKAIHMAIEVESDEMTDEILGPVEGKGLEKIGSVEIIFSTLKLKNDLMNTLFIVFFFTVITIALRIISDYFFTAGITNPIRKIVIGSEAVAGGDLTQRIDVVRSDEVGKLASSFNAMIRSLKERDDEIKSRQQQIEDNVKKLDTSLKEKELLLKEVHHRVKNNMQLISSMLKLQSKYLKDEKALGFFKDCRNRIKSMALIHEKLYKSQDLAHIDFARYIKALLKGLFQSHLTDGSKVILNIDIENISLTIDTAIPSGLIVNELISNSLKYAFPNNRKGEISIILRLIEKDRLELIVSDNGIGLPKDLNIKSTESLGLKLVTTLTTQLQGEMEINRTGGTEFIIAFKEIKYKKRV